MLNALLNAHRDGRSGLGVFPAGPATMNRPVSLDADGAELHASHASYRALLREAEQRYREAHDPRRPGYLARLALDLLDPSRRILAALDHVERHGGFEEGLWAFQPFAMRVGDLLVSALAGSNPQALAQWQAVRAVEGTAQPAGHRPLRVVRWHLMRVPRAQVEQALAHVERFNQGAEGLWPFQPFALSLGELLRAALRTG